MPPIMSIQKMVQSMPPWAWQLDRYCKQRATEGIAITAVAGLATAHPVTHFPMQGVAANLTPIVNHSFTAPRSSIPTAFTSMRQAPFLWAVTHTNQQHNTSLLSKVLNGLGFIPDNIRPLQSVIEFLKRRTPKDITAEHQRKLLEATLEPKRLYV